MKGRVEYHPENGWCPWVAVIDGLWLARMTEKDAREALADAEFIIGQQWTSEQIDALKKTGTA